ncbi:MAG: hypothetical protein N5P05_003978 [Chroococcopsis gigantea SAG 12.99]|jgi:putative membrane protein|nr:hypothetical protein [Chroococcopsis gigantea SAG 12.99]
MNTITNFMAASIVAGWIMTMAVFSIQNITPITLKLLTLESIKLPVGILLAFCLGIGFFIGALLPPLLGATNNKRKRVSPNEDEFYF